MRRFVKDRVASALDRARPALEEYISRHLEYPLGFPYKFAPAAAVVRAIRESKIVPLTKADLPPVRIEALLKIWLANRSVRLLRGDWDPGVIDANVQVTAHGTVQPDGTYQLAPQGTILKARWRDLALTFLPTRK